MSSAVALLVAAAGTFALRYGSVRALAHRQIPPAVEDTLRHAALAVIAALVVASALLLGAGCQRPPLV